MLRLLAWLNARHGEKKYLQMQSYLSGTPEIPTYCEWDEIWEQGGIAPNYCSDWMALIKNIFLCDYVMWFSLFPLPMPFPRGTCLINATTNRTARSNHWLSSWIPGQYLNECSPFQLHTSMMCSYHVFSLSKKKEGQAYSRPEELGMREHS